MTKKQFKHDMLRGLGSAVLELSQADDIEKYRDIVLWGCTHQIAYDVQSEGNRSHFLYELISIYPDATPFLKVMEKRMQKCIHSSDWEFYQHCFVIAYFAEDGGQYALSILNRCYQELYEFLLHKKKRNRSGVFAERDNMETLCVALVLSSSDSLSEKLKRYQNVVQDLGNIIDKNSLYSAADFEWFQTRCEEELGKKRIKSILDDKEATDGIQIYAEAIIQYKNEQKISQSYNTQTVLSASGIYEKLKATEQSEIYENRLDYIWMGRRLQRTNQIQEVKKLADYYQAEQSEDIRLKLLYILSNKDCAYLLNVNQLVTDSKSLHQDLSERAFNALSYLKNDTVHQYARELLKKGEKIPQAISMLANNYEEDDYELFVKMVKKIPVSYTDGWWHGAYSDTLRLIRDGHIKQRPKELLYDMYQNTLCSYCRERIVKEMGRRRMLTKDMLEEMLYDSNSDIRDYAEKKIK